MLRHYLKLGLKAVEAAHRIQQVLRRETIFDLTD